MGKSPRRRDVGQAPNKPTFRKLSEAALALVCQLLLFPTPTPVPLAS